ncbi:RILP-like protein 2 isoform X2 [Stigmatopora nigra]
MDLDDDSSPALAFEKDAFELTVEDVYDISYVVGRDLLRISRAGEEELRMERDNLKSQLDRMLTERMQVAGANQMVVDLSDPNRPRFTMHELKEVLQERNHLKAQLMLAQEELQLYKSKILPLSQEPMVEVDQKHNNGGAGKADEEKTTIGKLFSFRRK